MRTTLLIAFVLILVLLSVVSSKTEYEVGKPPVHKIIEGQNISLKCNATESEDVEIFWIKNDTKLRFRENGTELNFTNINRKFAGDYVCYSFNLTAENETEANATAVEVINIDVLYPAKVTRCYMDQDGHIMENKTFTIAFAIEGNPTPIWSILNNRTKRGMLAGKIVMSGSITSWPIQCEDAGFWMCTAYNSLNHGINSTWGNNLTVFCSPKPNPDYRSIIKYDVRTKPGRSVALVMYNLGHPSPNYTWAFNGTVIPKDSHWWHNDTYSILHIPNVQVKNFKDFGTYTLTMSNSVGSYTAEYKLVPDGGPVAPKQLTFSDVTSNSVTLHWVSGYDMGYPQWFFFFKWNGTSLIRVSGQIFDHSHNHGVQDNFTFVQTQLQPSTHYNLTLSAENGYSNATYCQEWISFTTLAGPSPVNSKHNRKAIIIGCSVGGFVFIGLMAFLVYVVKYRHLRTTYETNPIIGKK